MSAPDIRARLSRLESTIKRDRILALLAIAFIFIGSRAIANDAPASAASHAPIVIHGDGFNATLDGRGLTVRDAAGHERALCGVDDTGKPSVDLSDSHGTLRGSFYLRGDSPTLREFDASGKRRADLALDDSGGGELLMTDANETLRMALFRSSNGDPKIGLYGTDGKIRAYWATDDTSPYFVIRDADGNTRLDVGGFTDNTWGLDLRSATGTTLWKAP